MLDEQTLSELRALLTASSVASLATLRDGAPAISLTPWAAAADGASLLIHVSGLAQHTREMLADSRVAAMVAEPETSGTLAQALPRVIISGLARQIDRSSPDYEAAKSAYLARHPRSEMTFGLGDFSIFAIEPHSARYIAGFGRAFDVETSELAQALKH
ncbi:MAG: pyridoxamine 5'-phosphate oxidase family protein [Thermoanaerobaculia bacterium]|nr:pyridoxamine 5'-phosphate oxidase family protein [Thermoanaerobaculia bacterium]